MCGERCGPEGVRIAGRCEDCLVVFSQSHFFTPIYRSVSSEAPVLIYLYLRDNHYHLITSMKGFLKKKYFCSKCLKPFRSFDRHKCNFVSRVRDHAVRSGG